MGRRIFKKVYSGETLEKHLRFVYDGYKLIEERDALNSNALVRRYVWQPESLDRDVPLTVYDASAEKTYYYHTDANKNVTELSDENGEVVAHYEYSPFGSLTKTTAAYAASNPFRFSSEYFDEETGLVYYNYRYYNPELGRWISRDPIEEQGGYNLYGMIGNNPLYGWDELGFEVNATYDKSTGKLTVTDNTSGQTVTADVESGGKPYGQPIPDGSYDILDPVRKDPENNGEDFYRLEPKDENYGDDKDEKTNRNNFRLHRPGRTVGCIACKNRKEWEEIQKILTKTQKTPISVKSKSKRPFRKNKPEPNHRRGTLDVVNGGK